MKRLFVILLAMFSIAVFSQEEKPFFTHFDEIERQVIPEDTAVRKGVLDNGLTYYVRRCNNPAKSVSFQLLVKGGSILESDNEQGIAHFVEHMMFKGTKHFPGSDVIGFMRRNGIPFGHDSNAMTGFNTVRYFLNSIPSDNEHLIDSCLLLLRDWAGDAIIDSKDVESEHNVIVEEWRSKSTMSFGQQLLNDIMNNSIYTKRVPIGDMETVQNCSSELVRNFYKRWYQPQNQAVVVVGDIEPDKIVKNIRDRFDDMKRGEHIAPTPPMIPDFDTPRVCFYQYKQMPYCSLILVTRTPTPAPEMKDKVGGYRTTFLREKVKDILNKKLDDIRTNKEGIYSSGALFQDLADVGNTKLFFLTFDTSPNNWKQSAELLAKQIEFIRRNGFKDEDFKEKYHYTSPEYNADSTAIIMEDTSFVATNDKTYYSDYAKNYIGNFFSGDAIMSGIGKQLAERHIKNTITKEQLYDEFMNLTNGRNMLITLLFPEGEALPSKDEVESVFNNVKNMTDEEIASIEVAKAKKFERIPVDSLDIPTVPGTVVKTTVLNDSISEVLLSNGVKVVFWKMKNEGDRINFIIRRPSGYSVLKDDEIHYLEMLKSCVRKYSYWGGWTNVQIEPYYDSFDYSSVKDKADACLKYFYASLTSTEVDSVDFEEKLSNLQKTAIAAENPIMQSNLKMLYLPKESTQRLMPTTVEEAAKYNIDRFRELVKEYFSNYNGSVLVVQGEYDKDSIMPSILKYIASLPSKPEPVKRMTWASDHYKTSNTTIVEKVENATPYCATFIYYTWEKGYKYTQETHAHNQVLQSILNSLLLNKLRMEHSDVYTPKCVVEDNLLPVNNMMCTIVYTCDPTQRERIAKDATQLVQDMADGDLITQDLIDNHVKEREKKRHLYKDNEYTLRTDYLTQEFDGIVVKKGDTTYIKQVTPTSLKEHLKQLLKNGNIHIGYMTTE